MFCTHHNLEIASTRGPILQTKLQTFSTIRYSFLSSIIFILKFKLFAVNHWLAVLKAKK